MRSKVEGLVGAVPFPVKVVIAIAAVITGFFVVVAPLFNNSGPAIAEMNGQLPTSLKGSPNNILDLDIDNTGFSIIKPLCVGVSASPGVVLKSVTFQGLETIPFTGGKACGGELTGQESISIDIAVDLHSVSSATLRITPLQGDNAVGSALSGTILVTR